MPTPERTTLDAIVLAARDLLEQEGLTALTMNLVAQRVGVRAPSLYKRVENRDRLLQLVAEATLVDFAHRLDDAASLRDLVDRFRAFGLERPHAFHLVMAPGTGIPVAGPEFGARASAALLRHTEALVGPERALEAARTLTAWAVGFVSMELNGAFQLGGDVEAAWAYGAETLIRSLATGPGR